MGKVYVIISGKGGVGKTTSAINLGSVMNSLGKETIVVDGNITTPNIGIHLGSPIVPITLNHVLNHKARVEEAIYEHESGVKILPASLSISELKKANPQRLPDIAKRLRKISDYTIIDAAAGLGEETKIAVKSGDEIIVIANPEMASVTDALKAIKFAEQMKKEVCGCIITRHTGEKYEMDITTVKDMLEVPLLGVIPEDIAVKESQRAKNPVTHSHPKSKSAKAYDKIARRLLGPQFMQEESKKTQGLLKKIGRASC